MAKNKVDKTKHEIIGDIIGSIFAVIVLVFVVPRLSIITDAYAWWLPIGLGTTIISGFARVAGKYWGGFWRYLGEIASIILSAYSVYMLYVIYPFDFAAAGLDSFQILFRYALVAALFGLTIALIVNVFKLAIYTPDAKPKKDESSK